VLLFLATSPVFAVTGGANLSSFLLAGFVVIMTFGLYMDRGFLAVAGVVVLGAWLCTVSWAWGPIWRGSSGRLRREPSPRA
jgi:hypothetical protein